MKQRPFSGSWPNFLCRIFAVVFLLQGISAQPVSNQRFLSSLPDDQRLPSAHLERWPPHGPPQSSPSEHFCLERVSEKSKTPYPVFLPFTVPIPWPIPFNGTNFAPVPSPTSPQKTNPVEIPQESNPIFILSPQFEFVPLYYNLPVLKTTSELPPSPKATPLEKPTPKSTLQQKPSSKPQPKPAAKPQPQLTSKPQPKPILRPQPETVEPPTKSKPSRPVIQLSTKPQQKSITKPVKPLPFKPKPKSSDLVCEQPSTSKDFVPPPKHTWTPPPENIPEYIPPSPSNLHTRSSESTNDKVGYDYVTYEPQYYTVSDNGITYSPEVFTYTPGSNFRYDPYRNGRYDPAYYDQSAYVTYGPDIITLTEPTPDEDGFVTYGADTVTYTDVPVLTYPKRPYPAKPPRPSSASKRPTYVTYGPDYVTYTEPTVHEGGYITESPNTVTYTDDAPIPSSPSLTRPSHQPSGQPSYVTFGPETVTTNDPTTSDNKYITYGPSVAVYTDDAPVPPPLKRPTYGKAPRVSSRPPPPDQPPYVMYDPDRVSITEPTPRKDDYVTYDSGVAILTEDAPVPPTQKLPTPAKSPRPSSQLPPPYVTYPDREIITQPTQREGDYVTYASLVATHAEDALIPPPQMKPTSGKPQRPSQQPSASRPSPQTLSISSRSSVFPAPIQPEEEESGNVYFGPSYYTVVDDPNGEKAVIYESEIMSVHDDEPHLEPPGEDSNEQYYELQPEFETYYEEDPEYVTYFEENPQYDTAYESPNESQGNLIPPKRSNARIS